VKERNRNDAFVVSYRFDLGSIFGVGSFRVGRQVRMHAKPVPMFRRYVLSCVILLMDVQQRGLLQGEQEHRAEDNPEQLTH
jgi:hypothetical protein